MKNNPVDNSYVENLQEGLKKLMRRGEIEGKKDALNIDAPDNRRPDVGQNPLVAKTPRARYKLKSAQDRANVAGTNPTLRGGIKSKEAMQARFRPDRNPEGSRKPKKPLARSLNNPRGTDNRNWRDMRRRSEARMYDDASYRIKLKNKGLRHMLPSTSLDTMRQGTEERARKREARSGGFRKMRRVGMNNETLQPSSKGTEGQKAARKASKALNSAVRAKKTSDNWYSELSNARKAALAKGGHLKTWKANREKSQGNTDPSNPRNKISPALMSVSEPHQKIKSGARWKKGKTRFEAVSYIDNRGHEPTVSKDEVKKMRPLNIKKKKQKNNNS
tara:strand:+ start:602 stop:1597 length:996 start_codon:yes stop_codon:yes gene_type:complete